MNNVTQCWTICSILNHFLYLSQYILVYLNFTWSISIYLGSSRSILVPLGLSWSISIYHGLSCAILSYLGPIQSKMGYLGLSQAILGYPRLTRAISRGRTNIFKLLFRHIYIENRQLKCAYSFLGQGFKHKYFCKWENNW